MDKAQITALAQLLTSMKDSIYRLEKAIEKNSLEEELAVKKEILSFQKEVEKML